MTGKQHQKTRRIAGWIVLAFLWPTSSFGSIQDQDNRTKHWVFECLEAEWKLEFRTNEDDFLEEDLFDFSVLADQRSGLDQLIFQFPQAHLSDLYSGTTGLLYLRFRCLRI